MGGIEMKTTIERSILEDAIGTWGTDSQINMAIEECADLIDALMKFRRGRNDVQAVVTEIADVQIMCAQLEIMFAGTSKVVEMERMRKIDRLRSRLESHHKEEKQ